jgi:hypothetical protein
MINISGTDAGREQRIRHWVDAAMDRLEWSGDFDVKVEDPAGVPDDQEAWGGEGGVTLRPRLLYEDDIRLGYILAEEVAHVRLGKLGVLHGASFGSCLCQEMFATWFQYRMMVGGGFIDPLKMITNPVRRIPMSLELGRNLGTHLGAALAGSPLNQKEIREWLADPEVDDRLKGMAQILEILPGDVPPGAMAKYITDFYFSLDA